MNTKKHHRLIAETNKFIRKVIKLRYKFNNNNNNNKNDDEINKTKRNFLSKKIKNETSKSIESWTLHGLPNILRSKYILIKFFWFILFLAAFSLSIYFLINTINEYLQFNVTTVVRSINVDEIDYPVITICNRRYISNEKGYDYLVCFKHYRLL